jgi:hypothetical protein
MILKDMETKKYIWEMETYKKLQQMETYHAFKRDGNWQWFSKTWRLKSISKRWKLTINFNRWKLTMCLQDMETKIYINKTETYSVYRGGLRQPWYRVGRVCGRDRSASDRCPPDGSRCQWRSPSHCHPPRTPVSLLFLLLFYSAFGSFPNNLDVCPYRKIC